MLTSSLLLYNNADIVIVRKPLLNVVKVELVFIVIFPEFTFIGKEGDEVGADYAMFHDVQVLVRIQIAVVAEDVVAVDLGVR